jgi:hypothetical protein
MDSMVWLCGARPDVQLLLLLPPPSPSGPRRRLEIQLLHACVCTRKYGSISLWLMDGLRRDRVVAFLKLGERIDRACGSIETGGPCGARAHSRPDRMGWPSKAPPMRCGGCLIDPKASIHSFNSSTQRVARRMRTANTLSSSWRARALLLAGGKGSKCTRGQGGDRPNRHDDPKGAKKSPMSRTASKLEQAG